MQNSENTLAVPSGVKVRYLAGGAWKSKKIRRKGKASQTAGKAKGITCQADYLKKFFARRSRSYKVNGYSDWCKLCDSMNLGGVRK
jgi:hypothetical protein